MKTHFYTQLIIDTCSDKHLSVDDIFARVQKQFPEVGKSSIYRNVEELVEKGFLTKLCGINKKSLFEKTKPDHAHLIDSQTGAIQDIDIKTLESHFPDILPKNFQVSHSDIKIFGHFS